MNLFAAKSLKSLAALSAGLLISSAALAQTIVKLATTAGDIRIELDAEKAPKSVANFIAYVKAGHYNGLIFHRVIENFMIQTGGYSADLKQRPTKAPIPLESRNGLNNVRGTIAMARSSDPNSATSQFFINTVDNPFLDAENARDGNGYAVFGRVIEGMEVVDQIRATPVAPKTESFPHMPVTTILINKATVESKK
ncbi:peptidylprolyl isomerase [Pelomonas sp. SE-A7]|uniref:peptidylprolyl isomerase n=1 Tax=Pelomonas sp. SE-A7 TaxID=3054953 RepID=UPI00259D1DCF|nr:peptidylprolyl isomerase [Pelomonas sp. SE-A7]MDM4765714.1 peptidylprolyl isomerase [Pelomonas sp. SE-A7]